MVSFNRLLKTSALLEATADVIIAVALADDVTTGLSNEKAPRFAAAVERPLLQLLDDDVMATKSYICKNVFEVAPRWQRLHL